MLGVEPDVDAGRPAPEAVAEPDESVLDVDALARIEAELADVARALERLDEGTYGTCAACGTALDDGVLAADPTASRCADHAG